MAESYEAQIRRSAAAAQQRIAEGTDPAEATEAAIAEATAHVTDTEVTLNYAGVAEDIDEQAFLEMGYTPWKI